MACGSRFLKDVETRYAMCELKAIAIDYAIKKCRIYLYGLPSFTVITDHRPLIPIFNDYMIAQVENAKLQRIKANLQSNYQFRVEWRKGKEHVLADGLSRAPVDVEDEDGDGFGEDHSSTTMIAAANFVLEDDEASTPQSVDPVVDKLRAAAKDDEDYQALIREVL